MIRKKKQSFEGIGKTISQSDITYLIDENEKAAKIINCTSFQKILMIPEFIQHEANKYVVTSILNGSFKNSTNTTTLRFASNSKLHTIEKDAFDESSIESISIPASLTDLKDGWCNGARYLTQIEVDPKNHRYSSPDGKILLGKSDESKEDYDIFVFCARDLEEVTIPASVKIIGAYSLNYTSIKKIVIPPQVTRICERAFYTNRKLREIEIPANSELRVIEKDAISELSISSFSIPASLTDLKDGCFSYIDELTKIEVDPKNPRYSSPDGKILLGKSDESKDVYDIFVLCARDVENITIPASIKVIGANAFQSCYMLKKVEIPANSELTKINSNAFCSAFISSIFIPSKVAEIGDGAFNECRKLQEIEIPENSELKIIGKEAFSHSSIMKFSLPPHVTQICESAFSFCYYLMDFEIPANSELQIIQENSFGNSSIQKISIPPRLRQICKHSFGGCSELSEIEIPENSELQIIEKKAFTNSNITKFFVSASLTDLKDEWCGVMNKLTEFEVDPKNPRYSSPDGKILLGKSDISKDVFDIVVCCARDVEEITIPASIKVIKPFAFYECKNLRKIEIPANSELQMICKHAFSDAAIESIFIPSHVTHICKNAFYNCKNLSLVEIPANSELKIIGKKAFYYSAIEKFLFPSHLTQICKNAFENCDSLSEIEIPENSELKTIEKGAFYGSSVNKLTIPASLIDLKDGWCQGSRNLTEIEVDPKNPRYSSPDGKMLLEKSDISKDVFDIVTFCVRDVEEITIPASIKVIKPYAFQSCTMLYKVEFPANSELRLICKYAFSDTYLKSISIPAHVTHLCSDAFADCYSFYNIEFPANTELQVIERDVFLKTLISSFVIPSSVKFVSGNAFGFCYQIQVIEISEKSEIKPSDITSIDNDDAIIMAPAKCIDGLNSSSS